jgi:hypothetical protein
MIEKYEVSKLLIEHGSYFTTGNEKIHKTNKDHYILVVFLAGLFFSI